MRARAVAETGILDVQAGRPRAAVVWGLPAVFWSLFAVLVAVHTYLAMLTHGHSFARLLLFEMIVWMFWVPATPAIAFLTRRFSLVPFRWTSGAVHLLAALVFSSAFIAWLIRMTVSLQPYDDMTISSFSPHFMQSLWKSFPFEMLIYCGTVGAVYAFEFYERSKERALRSAQLEREVAQARLDALSLQLQPHFLFNALHTVTGLIRGEEDQAAISTVAGLSDMLRYALDSSAAPAGRALHGRVPGSVRLPPRRGSLDGSRGCRAISQPWLSGLGRRDVQQPRLPQADRLGLR